MDRAPVIAPLQSGLKVIDALIPIGHGQRELILGDRQTGKTAIAIDTILNQRGKNVVCVYCAIGQRASAVAKTVAVLREKGAMDHTVVVVTEGNDPPGLAYIAPYAATSIAEHFMEAGHDVLIVYDELTQHARAYRELSLLLRRPPGREAFPGDIFYIHSRLLERATHLRKERGGGSLTALPIIETEAQNISAYIPTNLISITDGQIYLSPSLFELGVLPAVDVGKSVSRVGGKAQRAVYRLVAGDLKLAYAQFEELETFARFGARLDEDTRKIIEHGLRIRACLKQSEFAPVSVPGQIAILLALTAGLFDTVPMEQMTDAERAVLEAARKIPAEVSERFDTADKLNGQDRATIVQIVHDALAPFRPKPESTPEAKIETKPETKNEPKAEPLPPTETRSQVKPPAMPSGTGQAMEKAHQPAKGRISARWRMRVAAIVVLAIAGAWLAMRYFEQKADSGSVVRTLTASGVVVPVATTPVAARVSGVIQEVYCTTNMKVKAGQLCAKIDPHPYQVTVDQDQADLAAAEARLQKGNVNFARAKATVERYEAMARRRAISQTTIDKSRETYEQAQTQIKLEAATVEQLQTALHAAEINLGYTDIGSPIDGIVVSSKTEIGQTITADAQTPLFLVAADLTTMQINAKLSENDVDAISVGDEVTFTVESIENHSFGGEVTQIGRSPLTNQNGVTYDVILSVPNSDLLLKPGMRATLQIITNRRDDGLHAYKEKKS
jgi:F-type H+/Na+-transporting ATPase subunit alpha